MKEPTREQILERMVKNLIDEYVDEDSIVGSSFDYFYDDARKELIKDGCLTLNQRMILREKIFNLSQATDRIYTEIEYRLKPVKHMRLYYKTIQTDEEVFDSISGAFVSFSNDVFEVNRRYNIKELLR